MNNLVCHLIYIVMKFDNDTILDVVECWTARFVCIGIFICRYCGMSKKQTNTDQIFYLTDRITDGHIRRK